MLQTRFLLLTAEDLRKRHRRRALDYVHALEAACKSITLPVRMVVADHSIFTEQLARLSYQVMNLPAFRNRFASIQPVLKSIFIFSWGARSITAAMHSTTPFTPNGWRPAGTPTAGCRSATWTR
jgi:hypothetical protein